MAGMHKNVSGMRKNVVSMQQNIVVMQQNITTERGQDAQERQVWHMLKVRFDSGTLG